MTKGEAKPLIILAEAPLETVPRELWGHPSVYKSARKRGKPPGRVLLDSSLHHQAMRGLRDRERRGRPDIAHLVMLCAYEHPLVASGAVEVVVHTYGDYAIHVKPGTRLPRNYLRFIGLLEQLFEHGRIPPGAGEPLAWLEPATVERIAAGRRTILVDPEADETLEPGEAAELALHGHALLVPVAPRTEPSPRLRAAAGAAFRLRGLGDAEPWVQVASILSEIHRLARRGEAVR